VCSRELEKFKSLKCDTHLGVSPCFVWFRWSLQIKRTQTMDFACIWTIYLRYIYSVFIVTSSVSIFLSVLWWLSQCIICRELVYILNNFRFHESFNSEWRSPKTNILYTSTKQSPTTCWFCLPPFPHLHKIYL